MIPRGPEGQPREIALAFPDSCHLSRSRLVPIRPQARLGPLRRCQGDRCRGTGEGRLMRSAGSSETAVGALPLSPCTHCRQHSSRCVESRQETRFSWRERQGHALRMSVCARGGGCALAHLLACFHLSNPPPPTWLPWLLNERAFSQMNRKPPNSTRCVCLLLQNLVPSC